MGGFTCNLSMCGYGFTLVWLARRSRKYSVKLSLSVTVAASVVPLKPVAPQFFVGLGQVRLLGGSYSYWLAEVDNGS